MVITLKTENVAMAIVLISITNTGTYYHGRLFPMHLKSCSPHTCMTAFGSEYFRGSSPYILLTLCNSQACIQQSLKSGICHKMFIIIDGSLFSKLFILPYPKYLFWGKLSCLLQKEKISKINKRNQEILTRQLFCG